VRKSPALRLAHSASPSSAGAFRRLTNAYYRRDENEIVLVARDDEGRSVTRRGKPEHTCFLRTNEVDARLERELKNNDYVTAMRREGEWWRVTWSDRFVLNRVSKPGGWLEMRGAAPMEADVDPIRRYLTDHPVEIARPRRCYLDIEADSRMTLTDKESARMLAWSIVDDAGEVAASAVLSEDTDDDERELIEGLWKALESFDQVIAWAGDFFDFPYLLARTSRRRIKVEHERWLWLDHLVLFRRMNMSAAESGDEKQSLALDSVARSLGLGGKLDGVSGSQSWELWNSDPALLLRYCEHDTVLCARIEQKTGYVELLLTLCQSTFTFPDSNGIKPTRQVEGFLLRLGLARGMHFPTYHYRETKEQFAGAYVQEPTARGIVKNVHVCDFARLYPSVILTFNLSTETVRGKLPALGSAISMRPSYLAHLPEEPPKEQIPEGSALVPLTRVLVAQEPRGVLPIALEEALRLRKEWDKKKSAAVPGTDEWKEADRRSSAYKIFANSFYGVVGSPYSRFFRREVAESTAQGGVWLIKETIAAAKERGWDVIYGDTDSAFVVGPSDEDFVAFVAWCNAELYPRLAREQGAVRNAISLAYEKKFRRAVMPSKKRYAASYAHYKGTAATKDSKLEVKGLEYKRGDTSRIARRMQLEIVELILREEVEDVARFEALVDRYRDHVLKDALPIGDVAISKRLTKEVKEYAVRTKKDGARAEQATHVEIARVLGDRGQEIREGARIEFVVVDGDVAPIRAIPAEDYDPNESAKNADRFYLWEQLVFPPSQRVLQAAFPDHDWSRWERVRPPKPRVRKSKALPGQEAFPGFGVEPAAPKA
jgi:DNA polymerase elongation subunit (family B)